MATPLFQLRADLQKELRLSGLATGSDAETIFDAAIVEARAGLLRRLGLARVTAIVGYNASDTPTTDKEAIRLTAEIAEAKWVRMVLMRTSTTVTLDGAGGMYDDYHRSAPFRETGPFERDMEIKRLQTEINDALDILSGSETIGEEVTGGRMMLLEPDETPPLPGSSVFNFWP